MKCDKCGYDDNGSGDTAHACTFYQSLAQPAVSETHKQEPVAYQDTAEKCRLETVPAKGALFNTISPQRSEERASKPLTRAVLWKLWCNAKFESEGFFWLEFARAIEAAHGITSKD